MRSDVFELISYSWLYRKIESKQVRMAGSKKDKLPEKYGPFYFDQPIDHFSLNTSTFKHRYWANTDHYKQGGPVICKLQHILVTTLIPIFV